MPDMLTLDTPATISYWKRALYSLACTAFVFVLLALYNAFSTSFALGLHLEMRLPLFKLFLKLGELLAFTGWVLSLPLVFMIPRVEGKSFWIFLASGSALGPLALVLTSLYDKMMYPGSDFLGPCWSADWVVASIIASTLATSLYLFLIRSKERRILALGIQ
jgi:hypothetical protein